MKIKPITLAIIDCVEPDKAAKVLSYCARLFPVEKSILFTHSDVKNQDSSIEIIKIDQLQSVDQYSAFVLRSLHKYIHTSYCLLIQTDGFIINPLKWSDNFLHYDYIGAPLTDYPVWHRFLPEWYSDLILSGKLNENRWPMNGGFSLRSKRLLELTAQCPFDYENIAEDNYFNVVNRRWFEMQGITFAPRSVAYEFSRENPLQNIPFHFNDCLGFHGKISPAHNQLASVPFFEKKSNFLKSYCNIPQNVSITDAISVRLKTRFKIQLSLSEFRILAQIQNKELNTSGNSVSFYITDIGNDIEKLKQTISSLIQACGNYISTIKVVGKYDNSILDVCNQVNIDILDSITIDDFKTGGHCIVKSGTVITKSLSFYKGNNPKLFYTINNHNPYDTGILFFHSAYVRSFLKTKPTTDNTDLHKTYFAYCSWLVTNISNPLYCNIRTEIRTWLGDASFWLALYEPSEAMIVRFDK